MREQSFLFYLIVSPSALHLFLEDLVNLLSAASASFQVFPEFFFASTASPQVSLVYFGFDQFLLFKSTFSTRRSLSLRVSLVWPISAASQRQKVTWGYGQEMKNAETNQSGFYIQEHHFY